MTVWRSANLGMTSRHAYQVFGNPCSRTTGVPEPVAWTSRFP